MAIPVYLWLCDDAGSLIQGSLDASGREKSIETVALRHMVELPTDNNTGKITGSRAHEPLGFDKEIDSSSIDIYNALTTGENLKSAKFKYYRINDAAQEEPYLSVILEKVKVGSITSLMHNVKDAYGEARNHFECIDLGYEKITWHYIDGHIIHSDCCNEKSAA